MIDGWITHHIKEPMGHDGQIGLGLEREAKAPHPAVDVSAGIRHNLLS
jgi:hypothetical protein